MADAARAAERPGFDAFYATDHLMGVAGFAEIGVQRVVLSTPRPWHPDKLAALAGALPGLGALPRLAGVRLPAAGMFVL